MTLDEFNEAKRIIAEASKRKERSAGAFSQMMAEIKRDFACKNLEAADKKLEAMDKEIAAKEKKLEAIKEKLGEFDV
jgi:hypothetical protein